MAAAKRRLNDSAAGSFVSKRQSASEYLGTANAIDLRTEVIVSGFLRSLRKLLYRILGLYQQFAPPSRIFQVGGAEGVKLVKHFETDRLQGKLLLRLLRTSTKLDSPEFTTRILLPLHALVVDESDTDPTQAC